MSTPKTKENKKKKKMVDLQSFLRENEKILAIEKPNKRAYISHSAFSFLPIIIINVVFFSYNLIRFLLIEGLGSDLILVLIFLGIFAGFLLIPFWIWLCCLIRNIRKYKYLEYLITDERLIMRYGKKPSHITIIDYPDIINVKVYIRKHDEKYKTGQVLVATIKDWYQMYSLSNYYMIAQHFEAICKQNEEIAKQNNQL